MSEQIRKSSSAPRRLGKSASLSIKTFHKSPRPKIYEGSPKTYQEKRAKLDAVEMANSQKNQKAFYLTSRIAATGFALPTGQASPTGGKSVIFSSLLRSPSRFLAVKPTGNEKLKLDFNKELIKEYRKSKPKSIILRVSQNTSRVESVEQNNREKNQSLNVKFSLKGALKGKNSTSLSSNISQTMDRQVDRSKLGHTISKIPPKIVIRPVEPDVIPEESDAIINNPLFQAITKRLKKETAKRDSRFQMLTYLNSQSSIYRGLTEEDLKKKAALEAKLGLTELTESNRKQALSAIKITLDYCTECIKKAYTAFEGNQSETLFRILKDAHTYLVLCKRPQKVILEMFKWILEVLFEFGEYQWVIEFADRFLVVAFEMREFHYSLRYYELVGRSNREILNHKKGLAAFFKMLFAALYLRDPGKEMSAYASISRQYYELGDVTTASYFYEKFNEGIYEPQKTACREEFLLMETYYIKKVVEPREKKVPRPLESPNVSFYEAFPLDDREVLNQKIEMKKNGMVNTFDSMRKDAEKLKGFLHSNEELTNPLLQRRYNKRSAMESVRLGDVHYAKGLPKKIYASAWSNETERLNFLKLAKLNFTNNTDLSVYSHNSANRSTHVFRRIPPKQVKRKGLESLPLFSSQVTALRDDLAIMHLLDIFNNVGLAVEAAVKAAHDYAADYCRN
jgi:hypothetical protein